MNIRNQQLQPGGYFHIFNRGLNSRKVFFEEENYFYFLRQFEKYVSPYAKTFAYCLLKNHFHFLIQVREEEEIANLFKGDSPNSSNWHVSKAFSSWLKSYTQAVNKRYGFTGPVFENPFKRIEVDSDEYFTTLVTYIHQNPVKHAIRRDFETYSFSSYQSILKTDRDTYLQRAELLDWFGGVDAFVECHKLPVASDLDLFLE